MASIVPRTRASRRVRCRAAAARARRRRGRSSRRCGCSCWGVVEATGGDVCGDGLALGLPAGALAGGGPVGVGDAQRPVEGEPRHQLGVNVVGGVAADLPDAGIGLPPGVGDLVGEAGASPATSRSRGDGRRRRAARRHRGPTRTRRAGAGRRRRCPSERGGCRRSRASASSACSRPRAAAVEGEQHGEAGPVESTGVQQPGQESRAPRRPCRHRGRRRCRCWRRGARRSGSPSCGCRRDARGVTSSARRPARPTASRSTGAA